MSKRNRSPENIKSNNNKKSGGWKKVTTAAALCRRCRTHRRWHRCRLPATLQCDILSAYCLSSGQ